MNKGKNMVHTITLDIAADTTLGQLDDQLCKWQSTIIKYVPFGPAGGNPEITFEFDTLEDVRGFVMDYIGTEDSSNPDIKFYLDSVLTK